MGGMGRIGGMGGKGGKGGKGANVSEQGAPAHPGGVTDGDRQVGEKVPADIGWT